MSDSLSCAFKIAEQFSRFPGGRYRIHGPYSGEQFREDILLPLLEKCPLIVIDLTGANGYGASFLDESFGEIGKKFGLDECRRRITLIPLSTHIFTSVSSLPSATPTAAQTQYPPTVSAFSH